MTETADAPRRRTRSPWRWALLGVLGLLILVAALPSGSPDPGPPAPSIPPPTLAEVHASLARVFLPAYNEANAYTSSLSRDYPGDCLTDKATGGYSCTVRVALPIAPDETWAYDVKLRGDCWTATTHERYGAETSLILAYRRHEALAPQVRDVRRYERVARRVRTLHGCM